MKNAFTMLEMIFVIVVLGILASVAVPRFSASKADATIAKGKADVASIRSGIITERQNRLIKGDSKYISGTALNSGGLFGGVLGYGVKDSTDNGGWHKVSESAALNKYKFKTGTTSVLFTYTRSNGKFTCDTTNSTCAKLVN